ncbi:MAG: hypothetical protein V1874_12970 [Spirochaetota bacterium]
MKTKDILKLYNAIVKNISGDWLLIGGALLNVMGISNRESAYFQTFKKIIKTHFI